MDIDMNTKQCPLRATCQGSHDCLRDRCAWWIPRHTGNNDSADNGNCALAELALWAKVLTIANDALL